MKKDLIKNSNNKTFIYNCHKVEFSFNLGGIFSFTQKNYLGK